MPRDPGTGGPVRRAARLVCIGPEAARIRYDSDVRPRRLVLGPLLAAGLLAAAAAEDRPAEPPPGGRAARDPGGADVPGSPAAAVPDYAALPVPRAPVDPARAAAIADDISTLLGAAPSAAHDAAVRRLAGIGPAAVSAIATALPSAPWRARAALVSAVAEMDAPADATPLLAAAASDPAFAVREAAVIGLGKTGDARAAAALTPRARPASEPAWRVRAAAAKALRRAVLRGSCDRAEGGAEIAQLLSDPDEDVRRAALEEAAPLAIPEAIPAILAVFDDLQRPAAERATALTALRAYRTPSDELTAALRRGFLLGASPEEAVRAGRAYLDIRGVAALADDDVGAAILRHLQDDAAREMREALGRLGPPASAWIAAHVHEAASRIAAGRVDPSASPFEPLLDALFQVDESAGLSILRDTLVGPHAEELDRETRLSALRRAQFGHAAALAADLRTLLRSKAGRDVLPDVVRAVAASGGDDVGAILDEALRSPRADVRSAALDLLDVHASVPTPPALTGLATTSDRPRERARALAVLGRRDAAAAAALALRLLDHPDPEMRGAAVDVVDDAPSPGRFDRLAARLAVEDGAGPAPEPREDAAAPVTVTGEDPVQVAARRRRVLRAALVRALRAADPSRARPLLLGLLATDGDARVRETAAQSLLGLAGDADAAEILSRADADADSDVRAALLRVLASLGGSETAAARFAELVANPNTRFETMRILAEPTSRVAPPSLTQGIADPTWTDDERSAALRCLERAGRTPSPDVLTTLASASRSLDLCSEAVRLLSTSPDPSAESRLLSLLDALEDPERRILAIRAIGERRAERALPALLRLFEGSRAGAIAAASRTDSSLQLHRTCALALGAIGGDAAGGALAAALLAPDLATLGGRHSVPANGPFQPQESAVPTLVRTLVAALARFDEATCARLVTDELDRRSASGSDLALDKEYLDGVAHYLNDPVAFDLPPRRRPAAALPLWSRVPRIAPRWSPLDADALAQAASELETQGRIPQALDAYLASLAIADVEDAARPAEDRLWENGRRTALEARALSAAGRTDDALAVARSIRAPDPSSGDLAFRFGWCLVKLGRADREAADALRFAAARNARDASARFHLAWVTEQTEGVEASLAPYLEAIRVDARRVEDLGEAEYLTNRRGRNHRWGHHFYWYARALARAGRPDEVARSLRAAVLLDDRFGAMALADSALAAFADRAAFIEECLREIPDAPLR